MLSIKEYCVVPLFISVLVTHVNLWTSAYIHDENDILTLPDADDSICPIGYFKCNTTRQCVIQRMNCDGSVDCNDASDELNCKDDVDAEYWDSLYHKQPYGLNDDIPVGMCFWTNLTQTCPCRRDQIFCSLLNLTSIPVDLPQTRVSMIDLSQNNFEHLDDKFFNDLPPTDKLVLKFCDISSISANAFQRFGELNIKTIYLDENKLQSFNTTLFGHENNVTTLIISGNQINVLHAYDFLHLDSLKELDLHRNHIETFEANVFEPLTNLEILYLNDNRLRYLDAAMFPPLDNLLILSLAKNRIEGIGSNSFPFPRLENLFLAGNQLSELAARIFCSLTELKGLQLQENKLRKFDLLAFDCLNSLVSLHLKDNEFKTLDSQVVESLTNLDYIYFSWFHLCGAAVQVRVCLPHSDGISSTYHLLDNVILRGSVWVMAFIAIIGNLLVMLGRYRQKTRSNAEHSLYLRHLAASDFLMGVYLAIIASADINFCGEYIKHDESWRHSDMCAFSGFLSTFSCQSSTLLLTLVTWDRLMSVMQPLQARESAKKRVVARLFLLWSISLSIAIAPLLASDYFGPYFYGTNGVCLSLHIHDPYAKGWEYSAILFICINTISLIFILVSYMRMLHAIRVSGSGLRSTISDRESVVAIRFALIIATDCACWLPVILVKLAALGGFSISPTLYGWLAVLVLPLNSALNPVLYTLTTAIFQQQLRRYCHDLPSIASLLGGTHTPLPNETISTSLGLTGSCKSHEGRGRNSNNKLTYV